MTEVELIKTRMDLELPGLRKYWAGLPLVGETSEAVAERMDCLRVRKQAADKRVAGVELETFAGWQNYYFAVVLVAGLARTEVVDNHRKHCSFVAGSGMQKDRPRQIPKSHLIDDAVAQRHWVNFRGYQRNQ